MRFIFFNIDSYINQKYNPLTFLIWLYSWNYIIKSIFEKYNSYIPITIKMKSTFSSVVKFAFTHTLKNKGLGVFHWVIISWENSQDLIMGRIIK